MKTVGGRFKYRMGCRRKCREDKDCVAFKHVSANDPNRPAKGTCYWYLAGQEQVGGYETIEEFLETTEIDQSSDFAVKYQHCD